jgi:enoyl-CoA hydratase/carnithine racemase
MSSVLFNEVATQSGHKIAIATLNVERALNALNLEMIELLTPQLAAWQADDEVALIVLQGAGDKAFCAGGDVVSLYKAMEQGDPDNYIEQFFTLEYQLDYAISQSETPVLVWGSGIIMGGGLGLMVGASHRIVTETSRIAMPEITIGLYPDVGGSYFLNKMPQEVGLFLGLTGASINATDALTVKLADHFLDNAQKDVLTELLVNTNWSDDSNENSVTLSKLLVELSQSATQMPQSNIAAYSELFQTMAKHSALNDKVASILTYQSDDKWLSKAQASLKAGSPISAHLVFEQLKRAAGLSLKECFMMELGLSVQCGRFGEFQEGVRALLIDKDLSPSWRFNDIEAVTDEVLAFFFTPLWQANEHPLAAM